MKIKQKLKIGLALVAMSLSLPSMASIGESDKLFEKTEKLNKNDIKLIVKFKDASIHKSLLVNPKKEKFLQAEAESKNVSVYDLKDKYNLKGSNNYSYGSNKLDVLGLKNSVVFSHVNSLAFGSDLVSVDGSEHDAESLAKKLMATGDFESVMVDRVVQKQFNDTLYDNQTYFKPNSEINRNGQDYERMREMTVNNLGRKIRIGIADSGYSTHEDIAPLNEGYDFLIDDNGSYLNPEEYDSDPTDETELSDGTFCHDGHGLSVAGLISATSNNGLGVAGATDSNEVELVYARVLNCFGNGRSSGTLNAVAWLSGEEVPNVPNISQPVDIINLSLGGYSLAGCSDYEQSIYTKAKDNGVVVVVAAGNDASDAASYAPASCDDVITVGASNSDGFLASYSNYGEHVDVLAAGTNVDMLSSTQYGSENPYFVGSGTSMATPNIVGGIANFVLTYGKLDPLKIKEVLQYNGYGYSKNSLCGQLGCGSGIVNMLDFMKAIPSLPNIEKYTKENRYSDYESAEQISWLDSMNKFSDVCNSVKYTWGGIGGLHEDVTYKIFKEDHEGTMIYLETVSFPQKVLTVNDNDVIGVQACDSYGCGNIKRMIGKVQKPSYCEI